MNSNLKNFNYIDLAKFIFCLAVICIHTQVFNSLECYWLIMPCFFRLAVPFFFVCSGFLFGLGLEDNLSNLKKKTEKYLKRLLLPYIVFSVINYIHFFINEIGNKSIIKIILLTIRSILFYPKGALWYIWASMIGILILYFVLSHRINIKLTLIISMLLYSFALLCNTYNPLVSGTIFGDFIELYFKIFVSARNGLFVGFIFILLGYVCSIIYKNINLQFNIISLFTLLSYIILIIEAFITRNFDKADDGVLYISYLIFIPVLILFLSNINCKVKLPFRLLRNLSVGMYFLHYPVMFYINRLMVSANISIEVYAYTAVIIFTCFIICILAYHSKVKFLNKILK